MLLISRRQGGVWEERAMGGLGYDEWERGDDVFLEGGGGDVRWFCTAMLLGNVKGWRKAILQGRGGWVRADAGRVKLIPHSGQVANIFSAVQLANIYFYLAICWNVVSLWFQTFDFWKFKNMGSTQNLYCFNLPDIEHLNRELILWDSISTTMVLLSLILRFIKFTVIANRVHIANTAWHCMTLLDTAWHYMTLHALRGIYRIHMANTSWHCMTFTLWD